MEALMTLLYGQPVLKALRQAGEESTEFQISWLGCLNTLIVTWDGPEAINFDGKKEEKACLDICNSQEESKRKKIKDTMLGFLRIRGKKRNSEPWIRTENREKRQQEKN